MIHIDVIAGARPNFMKIAAIIHAIDRYNADNIKRISYRLIHTGQHYDAAMSDRFFEQLNIPEPQINFGVGSGTQANQTGQIMVAYELALQSHKPHLCIVVGDVTSTMACTLVAKKEGVPVAHVEGGIRSGDMSMPEEINRIVTDSISDYFFTTSLQAGENLKKQGVAAERIFFVGNTMIDTLLQQLPNIRQPEIFSKLALENNPYLVLTLHRPSNVDQPASLQQLLHSISRWRNGHELIFPMHPRTKRVYDSLTDHFDGLHITEPMDYLSFIYLVKNAKGVITDSGGITEETTILGVPCMTLRNSTERPETVTVGTNEMIGTEADKLKHFLEKMTSGHWKKGGTPDNWDGLAGKRIIETIAKLF